jgi:hypothetical protein
MQHAQCQEQNIDALFFESQAGLFVQAAQGSVQLFFIQAGLEQVVVVALFELRGCIQSFRRGCFPLSRISPDVSSETCAGDCAAAKRMLLPAIHSFEKTAFGNSVLIVMVDTRRDLKFSERLRFEISRSLRFQFSIVACKSCCSAGERSVEGEVML